MRQRAVPTQRLPVALQPIWDTNGVLLGHEYLYRSRSGRPAGVDGWAAARQDEASASVLRTVFGGTGLGGTVFGGTVFGRTTPGSAISAGNGARTSAALAFVNVTRSFLIRERPLPPPNRRLVLEVVETVPADVGVLLGLRRLRAGGYRIAVDDYTASADQLAMLPFADFVKVDCRDLPRLPAGALDDARAFGARLVAERVADTGLVSYVTDLGFEFLQGDALGAASTRAG